MSTMPFKNNDEKLENQREWRRQRRIKFNELKKKPCTDCGGEFPPHVMDFDHKDGVKLGRISTMATQVSWDKLLAEIAKCDLLCANCHRIRSFDAEHHIAKKWRKVESAI